MAEDEYGYAKRLARNLAAKHWPNNTGWEPLPDLVGVLTQIDNMTTLMDDQKAEIERLRGAIEDRRKSVHDRMFAAREAHDQEIEENYRNPLSDSLADEANWLAAELAKLETII